MVEVVAPLKLAKSTNKNNAHSLIWGEELVVKYIQPNCPPYISTNSLSLNSHQHGVTEIADVSQLDV